MTASVLSLRGFGVAFGKRVILSSISLEVPDTGIVVIMGPSGTGKSTLLRTIAGLSAASPALRTWGSASYAGSDLDTAPEQPALVSQSARLMMSSVMENILDGLPERHTLTQPQQRKLVRRLLVQAGLSDLTSRLDTCVVKLPLGAQRHLAVLRVAASGPKLLCVDEPTTAVDGEHARRLLEYLKNESSRRAIIVTLHNQHHAKALGGRTVLLAGGWVQESLPTETFFRSPETDAARAFIRSGSCAVPSPDATPDELGDEHKESVKPLPEAATNYRSHVLGPTGFLWLKKGRLAGTPRPGLLRNIEDDLLALKRVGVTHLISLTEKPVDAEACRDHGIELIRHPVPDMQAPEHEQAAVICGQISRLLAESKTVAVHCRAGLGRTGTILASQLIYEGHSAIHALEKTRNIEPRWVQSDAQVQFLQEFESFIRTNMKDSNNGHLADTGGRL